MKRQIVIHVEEKDTLFSPISTNWAIQLCMSFKYFQFKNAETLMVIGGTWGQVYPLLGPRCFFEWLTI